MSAFVMLALATAADPSAGTAPTATAAPALDPARSAGLHELVRGQSVLFATGEPEDQLPALDATLDDVASADGAGSAAMEQALVDTGVLLISNGQRYDLALPYFERALVAARAALGPDDPETAFALHDLATVRCRVAPDRFRTDAEPLIQQAIELRSRVLGADAPETAGSEREYAGMLLSNWQRQGDGDPADADLRRAADMAAHAVAVIGTMDGKQAEASQLRHLQVEVALARQDYAWAEAQAAELMKANGFLVLTWSGRDARQLRAEALRGLGRDDEAEALAEGDDGECDCGEEPGEDAPTQA